MEIITREEIETLPTIQMDDNTEEYCIRKDRFIRILDYIESLKKDYDMLRILYKIKEGIDDAEVDRRLRDYVPNKEE